MQNNWHRSIEKLLEKYCSEATVREKIHRNSYYKYKKMLTWFQIPLISISAINAAMQFLSKSFPVYESTIITVTGSTSVFVSILTAVSTYLKLGENAANHSKAQSEWLNFYNTIRYQLVLAPNLRMDGQEFLANVKTEYEKLFEFSPIPDKAHITAVKKSIKKSVHPDFVVPMYLNGFSGVDTYREEDSFEDNSIERV